MSEHFGGECKICGASDNRVDLLKCPICHGYFCDKCRYTLGGINFCSGFCANYFFWAEEED